jgi:carbamoyltransferase
MILRQNPIEIRNSPYILGLSPPSHDAAAALLDGNAVKAAVEESKLVRSRSFSGVPYTAARFCLNAAGVDWHDVGIVAIASRPSQSWFRKARHQARFASFAPLDSVFSQATALGELGLELNSRRALCELNGFANQGIVCFDHHLCHAASAFYASPFESALILTLDERGDGISGTIAIGEGNRIRVLQSTAFPHSLALVFSLVTDFLGFTPRREEHKTQWLSLYGEPVFKNVFLEMLRCSSNGNLHLNLSYFKRWPTDQLEFSEKFCCTLGLSSGKPAEARQQAAPHVASSLQHACAAVVTQFLETWRHHTNAKYLCLSGGLFLNALLVAAVKKSTAFADIFVQPAAGNAGCALGAAWLARHHLLGKPRQEAISNVYWGPSFNAEQTKQVLDNCKAPYRWFRTEMERNDKAVRLLEKGKIVAWHQGAAEFGPRALGNRSLLASPWAPYVRENLNDYVKHRKSFQPFAIAVTEEDCPRYFDNSRLENFMTSVASVNPSARELIRDFVLPGNLVRLHVVQREANPVFWGLLNKFGERAPAPMLINTSFNLFGEPLVISPRDAIRSFFCSGVDALAINGFVMAKSYKDLEGNA